MEDIAKNPVAFATQGAEYGQLVADAKIMGCVGKFSFHDVNRGKVTYDKFLSDAEFCGHKSITTKSSCDGFYNCAWRDITAGAPDAKGIAEGVVACKANSIQYGSCNPESTDNGRRRAEYTLDYRRRYR